MHKPWSTANPLKDLSLIKTILQGWAMIWKKKLRENNKEKKSSLHIFDLHLLKYKQKYEVLLK